MASTWVFAAVRTPAAAPAATPSCASGYAYAGVVGPSAVRGVAATLIAKAAPPVASGHIAAWVGVGGKGLGAGGRDEWIQAGISREPGGDLTIYREVEAPGTPPAFATVASASAGVAYRVAVLMLPHERWTVTLDGRTVGGAFHLPGSSAWRPVATAESWLPAAAACNPLAVRFADVAARIGGAWQPLTHVAVVASTPYGVRRSGASFLAALR